MPAVASVESEGTLLMLDHRLGKRGKP